MATVLMMAATADAQIFMVEGCGNENRTSQNADVLNGFIPLNGEEYDQGQYTSLGGGALLLAGLAGAYLFGKKRKN